MRKNNQNNKKAIALSDLKKKADSDGKIIDWSTLTEYNGQLYVAIVPKPEKININIEVK